MGAALGAAGHMQLERAIEKTGKALCRRVGKAMRIGERRGAGRAAGAGCDMARGSVFEVMKPLRATKAASDRQAGSSPKARML